MWRALQIAFALSLCGTAFSGVLTYRELFTATASSCPAPGPAGTILGYPACVYGFLMFLAIAVTTGLGLRSAAALGGPELAMRGARGR